MKVALVHDYIKEYGGAERVLKELSSIFPDAPIYTAFRVRGSTADKEFKGKKIIESFLAPVLKVWRLYSPLRFLTPVIWRSFDLSHYDLIIASSSWYITRGFKIGKNTKVICYCHTPPRWLYGYETSVGFTRFWPVKVYAAIVGHFMRMYDFETAQEINHWIVNSENVRSRVRKFYRKDSKVIYPPVEVSEIVRQTENMKNKKENYFLLVARLVGAKGIEEAVSVASKLNLNLKVVGEAHGFSDIKNKIQKMKSGTVEILGLVSDKEKHELMAKAKAFLALAKEEDFGITPVESQAAGTPVIAFNGGGYKETIQEGVTGVFIDEINAEEIQKAIRKVENTNWKREQLLKNARKFSKEKFSENIKNYIKSVLN